MMRRRPMNTGAAQCQVEQQSSHAVRVSANESLSLAVMPGSFAFLRRRGFTLQLAGCVLLCSVSQSIAAEGTASPARPGLSISAESTKSWIRKEVDRVVLPSRAQRCSVRIERTGSEHDIKAVLTGDCGERDLKVFVWGKAPCEKQPSEDYLRCSRMCVSAMAFGSREDPVELFDRYYRGSGTDTGRCSINIPDENPSATERLEVFRNLRVYGQTRVPTPVVLEIGEGTERVDSDNAGVVKIAASENMRCEGTVSVESADNTVRVALHAAQIASPPPPVECCSRSECTDKCSWTRVHAREVYPFPEHLTTRQKLGIGLIAAGAAGVGLGVGFGAAALTKRSDSNKQCGSDVGFSDPDICTAEGVESNRTAQRFGTAAIVSLGVGVGAAAVGAALLWIWTDKADQVAAGQSRTFAVAPLVGGGASGLNIQTTW